MMKWQIPAKTFLIGEYAALQGFPSLILTTRPCFELTLLEDDLIHEHTNASCVIHPDSPAGRWWRACGYALEKLAWFDPYQGAGGLGASSAQFVGAYLASQKCRENHDIDSCLLLDAYRQCAWQGEGVPPSGHDVVAQQHSACVYNDGVTIQRFSWTFPDLSFLLVRTGKKLATHHHLQTASLPSDLQTLVPIIDLAKEAFLQQNSQMLIDAVNQYHHALLERQLVAPTTLGVLQSIQKIEGVLASKGCGALGADVLCLLIPTVRLDGVRTELVQLGWHVLASEQDLYLNGEL